METNDQTTKPTPSPEATCYASFVGKVLRKWDWWIYRRAVHSLRRITLHNPGFAYLMELQMRSWNEQLAISPELRRATELFHESSNAEPASDDVNCSACVICGQEPAFPDNNPSPYVCFSCSLTEQRSCDKCRFAKACDRNPRQAFGCPLYLPISWA
jgi:hypothetical protein